MRKYVECMLCDTKTFYKESDIEWEEGYYGLRYGYIRCSKCGTRILV